MKPNHDVFVGQEFWVQHRVGFFPAAKSPPRRVNVKQQADVIHRDKLMTKEDKEIRRKAILQRNWREPINVDAVNQLPSETSKLPIDAATTVATIANYPHQTRRAGATNAKQPGPAR
ncbi:hypothetical protein E4U13_005065 [Claviceps humidiphila]|uniref:Uncharacterized protein n=1 Tax=Claviceps humidiphila TaxID=1294629 RepID=A0A9P7PYX4_9HYPO|nr:hypothetical protein E4U13_005065 [Claviceps humidiphila]